MLDAKFIGAKSRLDDAEPMRAAIDAARAARCYKMALTSRLDRTEAHSFYERLGFVTTQRSFRMDL